MPSPRRLSHRLSQEQVDRLAGQYERGATAAALAAEAGVSKSALLDLFSQAGTPAAHSRSLTETEVDEASRLYDSGWLLREIGEHLGVSRDCVRLALKRRGIELRPGLGGRQRQ
jgi:hypothetical protein